MDTPIPSLPPVSAEARYEMAVLALGEKVPPPSFYADLVAATVPQCQYQPPVAESQTEPLPMSTDAPLDTDSDVDDNTADQCASQSLSERSQEFLQLMEDKLRHFGDSQQCDAALSKAIARLRAVTSGASLTSFLHNPGLYRRHRAGSIIRVQPTALSRRRPEVTRGSKRLASGRPPLGSAALSRKKRPCTSLSV